jgi:uncharacterized protein YyaL (SSP411 family)
MDAFFAGLERYWDHWAPIPGYDAWHASPNGDDKYYDDNAWMVLTFCEAYGLTGDARYLRRAEATQRFVLSGWDEVLNGGIYWRPDNKSKNTCSNGPAATGALLLAERLPVAERGEHVGWAKRIVAWTNTHLQSPDGTFWDNVKVPGGEIERTKWTYNTALMLRANLGLYRQTREATYLTEAKRLARASEREFVNKETGAFRDNALFSHLLVEAFLDLYKETREPYLLGRARRNAAFAYRYLRDQSDGGYWSDWKIVPNRNEPRKKLIENAAVARMFWLLAPYPDVDELVAQGHAVLRQGDRKQARALFEQALSGDPDFAPARAALAALSTPAAGRETTPRRPK